MKLDTIRVFAVSRLAWIKQQQQKLQEQARETQREYLNRESHFVWGKRYLLVIHENEESPSVELNHNKLILHVRPGTNEIKKQEIVEVWYRQQLKKVASPIIVKWESLLNVNVNHVFVQKMKTLWGSCNKTAANIRLNTDLAKKPPESLEYIIVHEMVHLIEPTHNKNFISLMDRFMPKWQFYRSQLNRLPLSHENWSY